MLQAVIFDFDGVVVDSEPIHLRYFQEVLKSADVTLTREDYYEKYLGYDDRDCFRAVALDSGVSLDEAKLAEMIAAKTALVQRALSQSTQALGGAVELIRSAAGANVPVAVCSGALRDEIFLASRAVGVLNCFSIIVAGQDVKHGKPDAEGYNLALQRLGAAVDRKLAAERCVVVEDSPAGITAAKAAGMKVLAVTTSYRAEMLAQADRIVASLADVTLPSLEELL